MWRMSGALFHGQPVHFSNRFDEQSRANSHTAAEDRYFRIFGLDLKNDALSLNYLQYRLPLIFHPTKVHIINSIGIRYRCMIFWEILIYRKFE